MKNVLLVMNKIYLLLTTLLIIGCSDDTDLVLLTKDINHEFKYPKKVSINYQGFKVAEGVLLNDNGTYRVVDMNEEMVFHDGAKMVLRPVDIFGIDYEIGVDSMISINSSSSIKDTFYYSINNKFQSQEKVQEVVETFKELVDTLIESQSSDSIGVDSIPW